MNQTKFAIWELVILQGMDITLLITIILKIKMQLNRLFIQLKRRSFKFNKEFNNLSK